MCRFLQVLFSKYCPLLDTGLTLGMRLLYTSVTWCYGEWRLDPSTAPDKRHSALSSSSQLACSAAWFMLCMHC